MEVWKPTSRPITYAEWLERGPNIERLVIHFWADWNIVDRQADGELLKVFDDFHIDLDWRSFDTSEKVGWEWLQSTGAAINVPSVMGFAHGKEVGKLIGKRYAQDYRMAFTDWFS